MQTPIPRPLLIKSPNGIHTLVPCFLDRSKMSRSIIRSLARLAVLLIIGGLPAKTIASGCPCNYVPIKVLDVIAASTLLVERDGSRETIHVSHIQAPRPAPDSRSDSTWCESEGQKAFEAKAFARSLIEKPGRSPLMDAGSPILARSLPWYMSIT